MTSVILTAYNGTFLGPIAKLLGYILQGLYAALSHIGIENTGLCIILFTIIVNLIMLPMQVKQQKFGKMSAILNPELQEIQKKYKNKKDQDSQQKMAAEQQALYAKYGVSPASGCLPLLITFPILFALYRVIYNVPAYVPQVKEIYVDLATNLQGMGATVKELSKFVDAQTYVVTDAVKHAATNGKNIDYYIDILSQLSPKGWNTLAAADQYKGMATQIHEVASKAVHINTFLGLNLANKPTLTSVSIIIPILSVVTQFIATKITMAGSPQMNSEDNPTAQSMNMMNNVMPFVTGAMCLMFPIGVGIYWVASNVFRIVQSAGINWYFDQMDMEEEIKKNVEKRNKKQEKLGIDPKTMQNIAAKKTSNISDIAKKNVNNGTKSFDSKAKSEQTKNKGTNTKGNRQAGQSNDKKGSIASYANLLSHDRDDNQK